MSAAKELIYQFLIAESNRLEQTALPFIPYFGPDNWGTLHCLEMARQVRAGQFDEVRKYLASRNKQGLLC